MSEWDELRTTTAEALAVMLGRESEAIGEDAEELGVIAGRMTDYWRKSMDGDETADRMIRHLKAQARLLVEIHHVEARRNLASTIERILTAMAEVGLAMLRAGLKVA